MRSMIIGFLITLHLSLSFAAESKAADTKRAVGSTKLTMGQLQNSLEMYVKDCGQYPESLESLFKNLENCQKWGPHPYLNSRDSLKDGWGRPLIYELQGARFSLKSLGRDGNEGGLESDIDILLENINR